MVAAGPFTLADDLDYAPLDALLSVCRRQRPDALVLLGPFVDAEQPLVASGLVDMTFQDIFQSQVSAQPFCTLLPDYHSEDELRA